MGSSNTYTHLLELDDVRSGYGETEVLNGISMTVDEGEVVALIGRNGAGKTTTLRTIMGHIIPTTGMINYRGDDISQRDVAKTAQQGITLVPEDRQIFPGLSIRENAKISEVGPTHNEGWDVDDALSLFANLEGKENRPGSALSGGEQQMLAIARALVSGPELLVLDEPTEGLAPKIVDEVAGIIADLKSRGLTILLVEQNVETAIDLADRVYVLDRGEIVFEGTTKEFNANEQIKERYLGVSE
ncbi:ABC transporter ATP-binding protein [Halopenitus persicus]|uniref:ABC transporter ATP-binding protein n=1 Tax=Halopenitus persicus TaxID=1048396 RepID=UPI000BBAE619|nr:ABC transporter ATP-binding protein [Halopenitus persicus]